MINSIMCFEIRHNFCTIYHGNISATINASDKYLIKKAIARRWLIKEPPTKEEWVGIVKEIYNMEKLTFSLNLCMDKFTNYWRKWTSHFGTEASIHDNVMVWMYI